MTITPIEIIIKVSKIEDIDFAVKKVEEMKKICQNSTLNVAIEADLRN